MLEKVKLALRISHNKLDAEIQATIDASKSEMIRAGIIAEKVDETDPLIIEAIKAYCKYSFASDEKMRDGYFISWQYQLDCLRKSENYGYEVVAIV